ncbi:hypothetical protein EBZ80_17475 [bacterium]|nr:hypothetical protein [Betaproteobacteria bacterium]NDE16718.1 hypothetical protein [bacterium]
MSDDTRHHLSKKLRTMHGMVDRQTLDAAADELDRLNSLIAGMVTKAAADHQEARRKINELETRIQELNRVQ